MKNIICCFALIISTLSCSQNNKKENMNNTNDIKKEINKLERFKNEPVYQMRINTAYSFTVLINGIPIANKYVNYLNSYLSEINSCIPQKGEQTIEIQIFPRYLNASEQNENLENNVNFELKIEETSWKDGNLTAPKVVYQYNLPEGDYTNKKMLIYKAKFEANTPYKLVDWREGKTFNIEDSVALKKNLLKAYENLKSDFENQHGENYMNLLGSGLFNLYQSSYLDKEEALNHINHRISLINDKPRKLSDIENYKLEILGDGKLISLTRIDGFNKNEGILRRYYNKGNQKLVQVDDIIFYAPKNSTENDLQVIWHRNIVKGANP